MAVATIQKTLLLYKAEEAELTYDMNNIMADRAMAVKKESSLSTETLAQKKPYEEKAKSDSTYAKSTEYQAALEEIEDNYELKLSDITTWESELDQKKDKLETQLKMMSQYEENCTSELKENIKKDFTYGGASASS